MYLELVFKMRRKGYPLGPPSKGTPNASQSTRKRLVGVSIQEREMLDRVGVDPPNTQGSFRSLDFLILQKQKQDPGVDIGF